jgi:hypothetical protein
MLVLSSSTRLIDKAPAGAASKRYKLAFGKDRAIDRAITELERVVRFQRMFRTNGAVTTEYEDNINKRLRGTAALALVSSLQSQPVRLNASPSPRER